jgi:citrate lyase gamma subunit
VSGVQSGTRLERLEQLQRAARLQRAYARWRGDTTTHDLLDDLVHRLGLEITAEQTRRPTVAAAVRQYDNAVTEQLAALGVSARTVKLWARDQGLIPAVVRGRVAASLVEAYAAAHQPQETA